MSLRYATINADTLIINKDRTDLHGHSDRQMMKQRYFVVPHKECCTGWLIPVRTNTHSRERGWTSNDDCLVTCALLKKTHIHYVSLSNQIPSVGGLVVLMVHKHNPTPPPPHKKSPNKTSSQPGSLQYPTWDFLLAKFSTLGCKGIRSEPRFRIMCILCVYTYIHLCVL